SPRRRFYAHPVQFDPLFKDADACVSYAPAATVAHSLLHGVPQLLQPTYLEAHLTARRVEALGAGVVLHGLQTSMTVAATLNQPLTSPQFKTRAREFAARDSHHDAASAADHVVAQIEAAARGVSVRAPPESSQTRALAHTGSTAS